MTSCVYELPKNNSNIYQKLYITKITGFGFVRRTPLILIPSDCHPFRPTQNPLQGTKQYQRDISRFPPFRKMEKNHKSKRIIQWILTLLKKKKEKKRKVSLQNTHFRQPAQELHILSKYSITEPYHFLITSRSYRENNFVWIVSKKKERRSRTRCKSIFEDCSIFQRMIVDTGEISGITLIRAQPTQIQL